MSKKIVIIAMLLLAIVSPMFAVTAQMGGNTGSSDDVSANSWAGVGKFIGNFIKFVVIAAGIIFLAKGTYDLIKALIQSSHDPNAIGKALIQMVIGIAIILVYFLALKFIFGTGNMDSITDTAPTSAFEAIQGAIVNIPELF